MKKTFLFIALLLLIGSGIYFRSETSEGASIMQVHQGGTGATTFTAGECLKGNGTGAITTGVCGGTGGGSGFDPDTNYGQTVSATSSPIWLKSNLYVSSTSQFGATSTFRDIVPATNNLYNLGSSDYRFKNIFGYNLYVTTLATSSRYLTDDGSAANPSYSFNNAQDVGLFYLPTPDGIGFSTNGIERAVFDSSGHFGINTSTPYTTFGLGGNFSVSSTSATDVTSTIYGGLDIDNGGLTYDYGAQITSINALEIGLMNFETDAGAVAWITMPIATTTAGLEMSYTAQLGNTDVLTIYGLTNGAGDATNHSVSIMNTTTPYTTFDIGHMFTVASSTGNVATSGTLQVAGNIKPFANNTADLGGYAMAFKNVYASGTLYASSILVGAGTIGAPTYSFEGDLNTGVYRPSADAVAIVTGGIQSGYFSNTELNVRSIIAPISTGNSLVLKGYASDGATAIGLKLGNLNKLVTAGAKILSFYSDNVSTLRSFITWDGGFAAAVSTTAGYAGGKFFVDGTSGNIYSSSTLALTNTTMNIVSSTVANLRLAADGANGLQFWTNGAERASISSAGAFAVNGLANCNTIDTDANGVMSCGTDESGAAAVNDWGRWGTTFGLPALMTSSTKNVWFDGAVYASSTLTVSDSLTASSTLVGTGKAGAPTYSFLDDSNTGFYHYAADELGFSTAGVLRARFGSYGLAVDKVSSNSATTLSLVGSIADSSSAVGLKFANLYNLSTTGANIANFYNNNLTSLRSFITWDGGIALGVSTTAGYAGGQFSVDGTTGAVSASSTLTVTGNSTFISPVYANGGIISGQTAGYNLGTFYVDSAGAMSVSSTLHVYGDATIDGTASIDRYLTFGYNTSTAWAGTTTLYLAPAFNAETYSQIKCETDVGTVKISIYDGTNRMDILTASTTIGTFNLTTNNSFTAGESRRVDIGTPATSPTKVSCKAKFR